MEECLLVIVCVALAGVAGFLWHLKTKAEREKSNAEVARDAQREANEQLRRDGAADLERQARQYQSEISALNERLAAAERNARDEQKIREDAEKRLVASEEEKRSAERLLKEKEAHYQTTLAQGSAQFKDLAQKILEDRERRLKEDGVNPLNALVGQLKQDIEALKTNISNAEKSSATTHTKLMDEISRLMSETGSVTKQANNLAEAIRGDAQLSGEWGEIQLKRVLDLAAMAAPDGYSYQETFLDDKTGRKSKRTDFVIKMTEGRSLIIDSKCTLAAAERYHAATDDKSRAAALSDIVASVRKHVDEIVAANYQAAVPNAFPQVLMYIPLEEVYMLAMKAKIAVGGEQVLLREYACRNKVVFVNSASVVPVVRLVEMMWNVERAEKNREATIRAAEEVLRRANGFVDEFLSIGEAFKGVFEKYEAAKKFLIDAPRERSLPKAVAELVRLGVRLKKRNGKEYGLAAPIAAEVES